MKLLKKLSMFHLYLGAVILSLSGYGYAEYYGYELWGSDEDKQTAHSSGYNGTRSHHK